jgi:hypothetical protein
MHYRTGPIGVLATGMAASTETRIRQLAIWKPGNSSTEDMKSGSSSFVFSRQNMSTDSWPTVRLSPRVLTRSHNYAFDDDQYGRIVRRREYAPFDFTAMSALNGCHNELLIKNAVSLLDDIEILTFHSTSHRDAAVATLATLGITQIRGVPVHIRFIRHGDTAALRKALLAARVSYHQDW